MTATEEKSPEVVLRVSGLGKEYRLYASPRERVKALFSAGTRHHSHWALRNVSFELRRGQCIGVIGDNGAGKSSLLKLLAGAMQPSEGSIERVGRVTAILELGAGFHPDFSGRDNLYFGGSLIGIGHEEMVRLEAGIVEFSGLGDALNRPVKTYSSGMAVRLAFALVTAVQPDVLIIDEALAVGDQNFQKKCVERIDTFRRNGCTILFCSHSLYHVRHLCTMALWLSGGETRALGPTEQVLASYESHVRAQQQSPLPPVSELSQTAPVITSITRDGKQQAGLLSVTVADLDGGEPIPLLQSPHLQITVQAYCHGDEAPSVGIMLEQMNGVGVTSVATHADEASPVPLGNGVWQVVLTFPHLPLHTGEYVLSAYLFDAQGLVVYEQWKDCVQFKHVFASLTPGLVSLPHRWS